MWQNLGLHVHHVREACNDMAAVGGTLRPRLDHIKDDAAIANGEPWRQPGEANDPIHFDGDLR